MANISLIYPYEFIGGQKAVASQVNANFEAVKSFANGINATLADIKSAISDLENKPTREMLDIYYSFSKTTPAGAYPLWTGETITHCKSLYPQFWKEINNLANQGNLVTVTCEEYEEKLKTYGQCAAFYIDTLNGHIRLPKITQFISSIKQLSELAKEQNAGLPNITGTLEKSVSYTQSPTGDGAFKVVKSGAASTSSMGKTSHSTVTFDASCSNAIYGTSETVQPPSVKLCLYIQVANNLGTLSELDTQAIAKELENALIVLEKTYKEYSSEMLAEFEKIKEQLDYAAGTYKVLNVPISPEMFTSDLTYEEYPFVADIEVEAADTSMVPTVNFHLSQVESGNFAPIAFAGNKYVRIYAKQIPDENFMIPAIILQ